ncbi:nectin-4 isoform X2 [Hemibagrus wyckioides]|uniref:nectin-4 isoform X2 n=1 Tax=Hemibagrus wyckioides TaxID=337641 RepID=UPI00266DD55C|nr:nectin-4 isoform X2 [Hemibagrus wyckioides]
MAVLSCLRILLIWNLLVCVNGGEFVKPPSGTVYTLAEEDAHLPCKFEPSKDEVIIQVIWTHINSDGTEEQIITAHHQDGQLESPAYTGRVRFENSNPIINSALIIQNTMLSDEGRYTCTIATFPSGSVKTQVSLTVWTKPISTLDPVILVEGQSFRLAATCRAMAKPQPGLSWDTDLPGQSQNRSLDNGVTSIQYLLHPLRSMNGRKLDCLVWHPSLKSSLRLTNQLVVHYPPEATISGYNENWYLDLEGAQLQCNGAGNPKPQNFTWSRKDGGLPDGVTVEKDILRFDRPLRLTDAGVYKCVATNVVGSGKVDIKIEVAAEPKNPTSFDSLLLIIIGGVAALLVLILVIVVITVNRHHKKRNKQLVMELDEKKEEISTLSRQASIRRVASVSIENKYQDSQFHPPLPVSAFPMEQTAEIIRSRNGSAILPADGRPQSGGGSITSSRAGSRGHRSPINSNYHIHTDEDDMRPVDEGSELSRGQIEPDGMDNGDSETASSQISEAMSNHFEHNNGTLWPKSKPNNIVLAPETTRLLHTNILHHTPHIV